MPSLGSSSRVLEMVVLSRGGKGPEGTPAHLLKLFLLSSNTAKFAVNSLTRAVNQHSEMQQKRTRKVAAAPSHPGGLTCRREAGGICCVFCIRRVFVASQ